MIQESRITITLLLTSGACKTPCAEARYLFSTMFPHEMNDPICLCKSLKRATGTFERSRLLLGMSGSYMESQCIGVEKLLLTGRALKRKMTLVRLQMIMHRILILFDGLADATHIGTLCVLLVGVWHTGQLAVGQHQFFTGVCASLNGGARAY